MIQVRNLIKEFEGRLVLDDITTSFKKGEIFTEENLTVKRPGSGISPMDWDKVIGQIAQTDFEADSLITVK